MFEIVFAGENFVVQNSTIWIFAILFLLIVVGLYLLRSFGLYKLATNCGDKKIKDLAYLSFIPVVWVYIVTKLAGRIDMFGNEIKYFSLILIIAFGVVEVLNLVDFGIKYIPVINCFLQGKTIYLKATDYTSANTYLFDNDLFFSEELIPYSNINAINIFLNISSSIVSILSLVFEVMLLFAYIALFRKYSPNHYTLCVILSMIGLFPIVIFIMRNKKAVDYNEYMRARYQQMYNMNNFNNQNNNMNANTGSSNDDPFANFDNGKRQDEDDNPFSEFDNKNK